MTPLRRLLEEESWEPVELRTEEIFINMGPQHPSTHGVLRLVLRARGEVVTEVVPYIGYLHRCAEKIGENVAAQQWIPYTDRMDYLAAMNMNLGWALTVEKLLGLEVPERGRHLRVILVELDRIASHLVAVGTYALDLGSFTPFMYCFREREKILNLFEWASGARLTYSFIAIGGARADLPSGWVEACHQFLDELGPALAEIHDLLTTNAIFVHRTAGVGVLAPSTAIAYGCTGPVLRGSGVAWDLRRVGEPIYSRMYQDYEFQIAAPDATGRYPDAAKLPSPPKKAVVGDCWHRYFVRMYEMEQSAKIVRQALDKYTASSGPVGQPIKHTHKLPRGEAYLETECPKGQMGFFVVGNDSPIPHRVRARSSSFCNLSVLSELCRGALIADIPAILGSLDIVLGEVDR
ncbi:MAG: NADH-quinone oxidoreductase subunit D [Thermoguttaceae bacterium]|nr:NADH-quinone oxidoreductase subunit D [Thermoguttaceae bacterium]MDW8079050.1 NADH-quinone oxidoreductase subunit D [Thermoguttaceae bacterium]